MTCNGQDSNGGLRPGAIVGGAFLLVLGGAMFLERSGFAGISAGHIIGPACLIILGMLTLIGDGGFVYGRRERLPDGATRMKLRKRGGLTGGLWLVGVGCWMLVSQLHLFGLDYHTSWPLLIILSGTIMLVRGVR
jgi:LiaI-LiaF-like transmembrane region